MPSISGGKAGRKPRAQTAVLRVLGERHAGHGFQHPVKELPRLTHYSRKIVESILTAFRARRVIENPVRGAWQLATTLDARAVWELSRVLRVERDLAAFTLGDWHAYSVHETPRGRWLLKRILARALADVDPRRVREEAKRGLTTDVLKAMIPLAGDAVDLKFQERVQRIPIHRVERVAAALEDSLLDLVAGPRIDKYLRMLSLSWRFHLSTLANNTLRRIRIAEDGSVLVEKIEAGVTHQMSPSITRGGERILAGTLVAALASLMEYLYDECRYWDEHNPKTTETVRYRTVRLPGSQLRQIGECKEIDGRGPSTLPGEDLDLGGQL